MEKPKVRRRRTLKENYDILHEAYSRLAVAIVEQACKDANGYYNVDANDRYRKRINRKIQMEEVKRFFFDERGIFPICMPNTDGPTFYKHMMSNWEKYGYYCPPEFVEVKGDINI